METTGIIGGALSHSVEWDSTGVVLGLCWEMEKKMETLGPFKGIYRAYIGSFSKSNLIVSFHVGRAVKGNSLPYTLDNR